MTASNISVIVEALKALPQAKRAAVVRDAIASMSPTEVEAALYHWPTWARLEQLPPEWAWRVWLVMAGRGFGKTRIGAEWVRDSLVTMPAVRIAVVARTYSDVVNTCIEGESGLFACCPPAMAAELREGWRGDKMLLRYRDCVVQGFTSEKPSSLRGPQFHRLWADEMPHWEKQRRAWEQVDFVVRLPYPAAPEKAGQILVTTTPLPVKEMRELLADATTAVTRGNSRANFANLNSAFKRRLKKLKGTRLERQEVGGELLDDVPGALWTRALVERQRVAKAPKLVRVVVGVDPAVTADEDSDETGIVVAGVDAKGHRYVLADYSLHGKPHEWAAAVVQAFDAWEADAVVVEVNQGGDMVASTLRTVRKGLPIREVHASRGKRTRAEPISTAYEQGDVWHVGAGFERLEDQMCVWSALTGEASPDRLDALVWACTALGGGGGSFQTEVKAAPRHGLAGEAR